MSGESSVLSEIESCAMAHGLCVLPRNPRKLYCSVWDMPDVAFHCGVLWRTNTGAVTSSYKGKQRFVRFGLPGIPDFLGWSFKTGQMMALEAKTEKGTLTPDQRAYAKLAASSGILAGVVRSYADCEALFQKWGLKRAGDGEGKRI